MFRHQFNTSPVQIAGGLRPELRGPRSPQRPVTADPLKSQLPAVTLEFFAQDKHLRVRADKSAVTASEILNVYTTDFNGSNKRQ